MLDQNMRIRLNYIVKTDLLSLTEIMITIYKYKR